MLRRAQPERRRPAPVAVLWAATLIVAPALAADDRPAPVAALGCEPRPSKGRVVCVLEIEAPSGRLVWADLLVVETPDFARPLRSRVGFLDATSRTEQRVRLSVAFLALREGEGRVAVRARSVVCQPNETGELCLPHAKQAEASLVVGPVRPR
jgi:hypothetical protein